MPEDEIYRLSKSFYDRVEVSADYAGGRLTDAEESIVSHLGGELRTARVLDLGVGTGRSLPRLRAASGSYVALDYSLNMLSRCWRHHRPARLLACDARRLALSAAAFDAAFFFFNGIDVVDHEGRLAVLGEIRRVLRPDGLLVFSSHNLEARRRSPWQPPRPVLSPNPLRLWRENAASVRHTLRGMVNRLRLSRLIEHRPTHSLINDQTASFSLITYYITRENQLAQLAAAGYRNVAAVASDGFFGKPVRSPCDAPWIYYVARKV